jgi:hypothetical protein
LKSSNKLSACGIDPDVTLHIQNGSDHEHRKVPSLEYPFENAGQESARLKGRPIRTSVENADVPENFFGFGLALPFRKNEARRANGNDRY